MPETRAASARLLPDMARELSGRRIISGNGCAGPRPYVCNRATIHTVTEQ